MSDAELYALRERVVEAMPWYDEANPDYTELDAILRELLGRNSTPSERLMTVTEVADSIHVHRNTVLRIPESELPVSRIGSRRDRRYRPSEVQAYLKRYEVKAKQAWGEEFAELAESAE